MNHLSENLWDDSIAETIANMPHEVQTDEECAEYVKEMLRQRHKLQAQLQQRGRHRGQLRAYLQRQCLRPRSAWWRTRAMPTRSRFGMLPWKVLSEEFDFNALYTSVTVTVPPSYEVYLNDVKLGPEYIVEEGIKYDVLEEYYDQFEGLPTKVTYEFDQRHRHR